MKLFYLSIAIVTTAILTIGTSVARTLPVEVVYTSNQCVYKQEKTVQIDKEELAKIFVHENRFVLPPTSAPIVDCDKDMLVLVAMGQKNNLGHIIDITNSANPEATLKGDTLKLPVEFLHPVENGVQGQIINSPCVVLKTPKVVYNAINIVN